MYLIENYFVLKLGRTYAALTASPLHQFKAIFLPVHYVQFTGIYSFVQVLQNITFQLL